MQNAMNISSINLFQGGSSLPRTTKVVAPNWNRIPSANMSTLSKEEIISQVKELADQSTKATSDKEKDAIQDKVQELYTQYVSFSSPDRKSLYEQALKTIEKELGQVKGIERANPQKTLIDFLNEHDNSNMKFDRTYQMTGGGTVTGYEVSGGGFIFDIGYSGNTVMTINAGRINGNGVYYTPTPEEEALKQAISNIFHKAVHDSKSYPSGSNAVKNPSDRGIDITI